ncbi:MAG: hypothetical protein Q8P57_02615 [Candidatus Pacearchaeota archaeon]|nr:hypothetical protein [Candidatus Pacearchaeota archaeon]
MKTKVINDANEMKGGINRMKTIGIVLTVLLISSLFAGIAIAAKGEGKLGIFSSDDKKIAEVREYVEGDSLDSLDIYEVETEIEVEIEGISSGDVLSRSRKLVQVWGFTYNDEDSAAMINGIFLKNTIYFSEDSNFLSVTKGKLNIGGKTFDLERVGVESEDKMVFNLRGPSNTDGVLEVSLESKYNKGKIKTWTGTLEIGGEDASYKGNVIFYTEERILRPEPSISTRSGVVSVKANSRESFSYEGTFSLIDLEFKFQDAGSDGPQKIKSYIQGADTEGKMSLKLLEKNEDDTIRTYEGNLFIQNVNGEEIEGKVVVEIERESSSSNKWYGKIGVSDKQIINGEETDVSLREYITMYEKTSVISTQEESPSEDHSEDDISTRVKSEENTNFIRKFFKQIFG